MMIRHWARSRFAQIGAPRADQLIAREHSHGLSQIAAQPCARRRGHDDFLQRVLSQRDGRVKDGGDAERQRDFR